MGSCGGGGIETRRTAPVREAAAQTGSCSCRQLSFASPASQPLQTRRGGFKRVAAASLLPSIPSSGAERPDTCVSEPDESEIVDQLRLNCVRSVAESKGQSLHCLWPGGGRRPGAATSLIAAARHRPAAPADGVPAGHVHRSRESQQTPCQAPPDRGFRDFSLTKAK